MFHRSIQCHRLANITLTSFIAAVNWHNFQLVGDLKLLVEPIFRLSLRPHRPLLEYLYMLVSVETEQSGRKKTT